MSLTRTARLSDASSAGYGTAAWVSGSFTPSANSLLVVAAMAVHSAGSGTNIGDDLTISGGSLTFTKRAVVNDTTYWGSGLVIFTAAVGASPSSMTLTLDCGANNIDVYAVHVVDYTGYDTGTPTGATASTASGATNGLGSITLSSAPAVDSEVFATLHGESVNSSNSAAPGSGWTELYDSAIAYSVFQSQVRSGSTSTSVEWSDVSVDSGNLYESHMAALEIRAGVAAAPAVEESYLASRRNRPGRGPYSQGRYFRQRVDAMGDPAFGADVSVALTGQSATASAGTLGHTHAKALTGSAATVSQGTLTPLLSLALVGSSVSSAAGSLDNATSVGLTGIGLTIAQGSVGAGADVTRALTGQSVTVSAGSVGPVISKALTGISLTASAGTVSPATQVAIAGQSVTVSQGTITAQGNVTVALTGQSVTVSVGSLVPQLTKALTGGQVTSSSGSLGASTSVALTGQSLSTAQGTLTAAATGNVTVALTGIEMRLYAGTIGTLGGDVAEKIGGDDVPMPSPHRGWDRRRSELKRTEEQKFLADIRRIYRDLVEEPSVADRAIEAVVQSHPEVAKQTRSANGVAEKARIAKITRRTDDLELSLRMLAQELIEFRAAAELDDERVIMRALSELL